MDETGRIDNHKDILNYLGDMTRRLRDRAQELQGKTDGGELVRYIESLPDATKGERVDQMLQSVEDAYIRLRYVALDLENEIAVRALAKSIDSSPGEVSPGLEFIKDECGAAVGSPDRATATRALALAVRHCLVDEEIAIRCESFLGSNLGDGSVLAAFYISKCRQRTCDEQTLGLLYNCYCRSSSGDGSLIYPCLCRVLFGDPKNMPIQALQHAVFDREQTLSHVRDLLTR